ncbi:MAG: putative monovalent cation/H+ antiporter subunit A [Alphaproteobacteria bacterium]|nr:putative monovalent cation/H+ antiporter subunit A [Alphaproteobacteria bacterium]
MSESQTDERASRAASAGAPRTPLGTVIASLVPAIAAAAILASLLPRVAAGDVVKISYPWVPSLGVNIAFLIDGLSLTFGLLISGICVIILLYSSAYIAGHPHFRRFYLYLVLFMASMLGLVLADNLIMLFVFWELTTITSYLLIGYDHASARSRRSALQALLVTGAGGLVLLAGFILLGTVASDFEISDIVASGDLVRAHPLYHPILILILIGAFTKSAQFPFHFWLPNAMAAPTPVSAFLHSATMVKAGIYLMARMHPALSGTEAWVWTLTIVGAVTALLASILALRQTDLKMMLAYTTIMALGTLTMFLGSEASVGIAAAVTFLIVHSLYKASLFLVVGAVDHGAGTRDVTRLGGLARAMPVTAVTAAAAALSMAGFPPFLGFIGKELKYEGALAIASEPTFVASTAVLANALMVAVAGIIALRPFYGARSDTPKVPHEAPFRMWVGPLALSFMGVAFGMAPWLIGDTLVQPAVTAILGRPEVVQLKLWHGINVPLIMSIATLVLGVAAFAFHRRLRAAVAAAETRLGLSGDAAYDRCLAGLRWIAETQTRLIQGGLLRRYIAVVFAVLTLAVGATLVARDAVVLPSRWPDLTVVEWGVVALILAGAATAIAATSRLAAMCALGTVGVGVALLFLLYGAPDVAITQLLVETLVVILVAVVMLRLPRFREVPQVGRWGRRVNAVLAVATGAVTAGVLLAVTNGPFNDRLTAYFETHSVPDAFGRNIVNVILVDFRALDTFGEVAVVAIAALAAYAVIKLRVSREGD